MLDTAGVFVVYSPGPGSEVGHVGVSIPQNSRPRPGSAVLRLSHRDPDCAPTPRPIIPVKREPKQHLLGADLVRRKLGHLFNPRQRRHWAGRTGTPVLIISHHDDRIADASEGGQIEGPRPVTVGPILRLPGDGNRKRLTASMDSFAHLGNEGTQCRPVLRRHVLEVETDAVVLVRIEHKKDPRYRLGPSRRMRQDSMRDRAAPIASHEVGDTEVLLNPQAVPSFHDPAVVYPVEL